jgi:acyl-CoA thioesterase-1
VSLSSPLIICFGDSLTAGFRSPTLEEPVPADTPYGTFLQHYLENQAVVRISGVCGERTVEMLERFPRDVVSTRPSYAVILGGTNDLGWNLAPHEIMTNLRRMYESAMNHAIQPVALTVPSIRGYDAYIPGRQDLNGMIQTYCTQKHVPCVDLFAATAEPLTGRLAEPYSNDGLHLTLSGYRLIAKLLFEQVFKEGLSRSK